MGNEKLTTNTELLNIHRKRFNDSIFFKNRIEKTIYKFALKSRRLLFIFDEKVGNRLFFISLNTIYLRNELFIS